MLVDRSVLIKYLEDKFIRVLLNDKPLEEAMYDYAEETYNFPNIHLCEKLCQKHQIWNYL